MWRRTRARVPNLAIGVITGLLVGGGAYAVATSDGVHGGPKPRFHDAGECNLVDVSTLPGNWTHGDYVSAVEKKDPSKVQEAARSRCGKPTHAGRGNKDKNKDKQKPEKDRAEKTTEPSAKPAKPSPKPSSPKRGPTATPSPTGSASPVVPLETASPVPSTSASPS
jgi:hypothetical protein